MAKSNVAVVDTVGNLPAGRVDDDLLSMFMEDSGRGVSSKAEDNIVPIIYLLQANSPATKKSNPSYVEGAVAGDIWKRNSIHKPLIKGEEGMLFQPCFFSKVWVEWKPNRGGLAGVHSDRPEAAKQVEIMNDGKPKLVWQLPNGNQVVETRQHMGLVDGNEPFVIPMSSTGHTTSRSWMQVMNQQFIPGTNRVAPSYAKMYRITTTERSKGADSWFVYKIDDLGNEGWVNKEQFIRGKQLFDAFNRGEKVAEVADDHSSSESTEDVPF